MKFPCTKCGCCCHRIDKVFEAIGSNDLVFPYKWDATGKCEKLIDNMCSIYETRPLICNIKAMQKLLHINRHDFYKINAEACNKMMDEDGIDIKLRIAINF